MFDERYQPPDMRVWTGRVDSEDDYDAFRWHQWIEPLDLRGREVGHTGTLGFALLGFCCDEGVRRNKGRQGAAQGPGGIRKALANLPCAFSSTVQLWDAGDILCVDGDLGASQEALAEAVFRIRTEGLFPLVLGGGHEVAFGHYRGHRRTLAEQERSIGIINFDAHFDLRPVKEEGSSGTMFRQIAREEQDAGRSFRYLCLGIQRSGNTVELFKTAETLGVTYFLAEDLAARKPAVEQALEAFIRSCDQIYVTICADVFAAGLAPGVSAPQPCGLLGSEVLPYLRYILGKNKTVGFDIAEIAPPLAEGTITANLARELIFSTVVALCDTNGLTR